MVRYLRITLGLGACLGLLSNCSSLGKSTAAGAGIGGVAGGIAGSLLPGDESSKPQNIIVGTLAGATIGALSGALIHKTMEDREREAFENGKNSAVKKASSSFDPSTQPSVGGLHYVPPKIERHWVGDEIRGNTLIEGHYEQVIVEGGQWE